MPIVLRALAGAQDLVVTRSQLGRAGFDHDAVARRTLQGIWRAFGPRVVVLHTGEITFRQRAWIGVLHAGPRSALAAATAAELGGLRGYEEWTTHVAVPHGSEVGDLEHPLVAVHVHQTRFPDQDVVPDRLPARHHLHRAVAELASASADDARAVAVLASAAQQRLVRPDDVERFVMSRRTLRRRRLILETLRDVAGGAESLPEVEYARALRRAGLPVPARQRTVATTAGRYVLDNDFEPWQVTVEINGRQHDDPLARDHDDVRRGALQRDGRLVVDVSAFVVRQRPRLAVLRTAEALQARGWQPDARCAAVLDTYRSLTV
jgi:very-short-patch-repair endonuclease